MVYYWDESAVGIVRFYSAAATFMLISDFKFFIFLSLGLLLTAVPPFITDYSGALRLNVCILSRLLSLSPPTLFTLPSSLLFLDDDY